MIAGNQLISAGLAYRRPSASGDLSIHRRPAEEPEWQSSLLWSSPGRIRHKRPERRSHRKLREPEHSRSERGRNTSEPERVHNRWEPVPVHSRTEPLDSNHGSSLCEP